MRDSVPSARYSPICNVLRQWKTSLIPIYRVYRLYDIAQILVKYPIVRILDMFVHYPTSAIWLYPAAEIQCFPQIKNIAG